MKKAKMTFMAILASFAMAGAGAAVTFVANPVTAVETKADSTTVTISERAETLGWQDAKAYSGWKDSSGLFTFSQVGDGNNSKYYTSDKTWRFYGGGTVVIQYADGYDVTSVVSNPTATFSKDAVNKKYTASISASTRFKSFSITYSAVQSGTLSSIALSGTYPTQFYQDDAFSHDGMTVTANYTDPAGQKNVTSSATFSGYDMATLGEQTVTVSYTENAVTKTAQYQINVVERPTLTSISISGAMTKTTYAKGGAWDPTGLIVTGNYSDSSHQDLTDQAEWSYNPASPSSTSIKSIVATATVAGVDPVASDPQTVNVVEAVEFDLTKISGFTSWTTTYGNHDLTQASFDPSVGTAASLAFKITNKQSGTGVGSQYPCIGAKTTAEMECLRFTLGAEGKKISSVSITFVARYTNTYPSLYLHKGAGIASEAVSSIDMSGDTGNEVELSVGNINDTIFTIGYNAHQTDKNGAVGIKSITIGLADAEAFGTLDHIKVTSLPNTIYHVGEAYDSTGFAVTAYDGKDEATANFKDVTASVTQTLVDGYEFKDTDVPGFDETVQYTESEKVVETSYHVSVYALAQYRLVTSAPADWSGNYLIVGENVNKDVCAMNGALTNPDVETGYKVVNPADGVIETGQELQWTIAAYDDGYSIQGKSGKFIGSLEAASNGMLVSNEAIKNTLSYSTNTSVITGTNGYGLTLKTEGDRFRYYSGGTVQLYKLIESDAADTYAQSFLATLSTGEGPVCQYDSSTGAVTTDLAVLKAAWASLAEQYDTALTPAEKEQFRLGAASVEGSNIQKALALYDHIASAYGEKLESGSLTNFDFMNRGIVSGTLGIGAGVLAGNNTAIILIALFSAATIAVAGGILFAKKHKKKAE